MTTTITIPQPNADPITITTTSGGGGDGKVVGEKIDILDWEGERDTLTEQQRWERCRC